MRSPEKFYLFFRILQKRKFCRLRKVRDQQKPQHLQQKKVKPLQKL